jgi:hypothetical protein
MNGSGIATHTWTKNGGPQWIGCYEYVRDWNPNTGKMYGKRRRVFTLVRQPKRGPVEKRTLYFSSAVEAKKKGWIFHG